MSPKIVSFAGKEKTGMGFGKWEKRKGREAIHGTIRLQIPSQPNLQQSSLCVLKKVFFNQIITPSPRFWILEFLGNLELGIWSFLSCVLKSPVPNARNTPAF
jgi:hypothetical protein